MAPTSWVDEGPQDVELKEMSPSGLYEGMTSPGSAVPLNLISSLLVCLTQTSNLTTECNLPDTGFLEVKSGSTVFSQLVTNTAS